MDNHLGLGLVRQPKVVLFGPGQRRQLPRVVAALGRTCADRDGRADGDDPGVPRDG